MRDLMRGRRISGGRRARSYLVVGLLRPGGRQSLNWLYLRGLRRAGSGADMARQVIMAVPTPAGSLPEGPSGCAIFTDRPCDWPIARRRACAGPRWGFCSAGAGRGAGPAGSSRGAASDGGDPWAWPSARYSPPANPWGNCATAPDRAVVAPGGGERDALNSSAVTLSWAFSAFGLFQGSGSTGYVTTNRIKYANDGSAGTYVCGSGGSSGDVQGSPVIYNDPNPPRRIRGRRNPYHLYGL